MINFIDKSQEIGKKIALWRGKVMRVTSVVLAVYSAGMAVWIGWSWWVKWRHKTVSEEVVKLTMRLVDRSREEALVRKVDGKANDVNNFLNERKDAVETAKGAMGGELSPVKWVYNIEGRQSVEVNASSSAQISSYLAQLSERYQIVEVDKLEWRQNFGWTAGVAVGGLKR